MTPTATVTSIVFIHLGVILVVTAYYALSAALAPRLTERARVHLARRPWLPVLLGIVLSVPWVIGALILMQLPAAPMKFAGAVLGCLWIFCGLIGGGAIAQHVGGAHPVHSSPAFERSWVHSVRGGLFITLTWVLPLVGWLGMLPLTLASGVGCLIVGFFPARTSAAVARTMPASSSPVGV